MALRFDRVPTSFRISQCASAGESSMKRSGVSWTLLTTMSRSPSLSRSANAAPRPAFGVVAGGPRRSVTSWNRPVRRLRYTTFRCLYPASVLMTLDLGVDVTVDEEQVEPAILVEIQEPDAPPEPAGVHADASRKRPVFARPLPVVGVQRRRIAGKVGLEDVDVSRRDRSPRSRRPCRPAVSRPGCRRSLPRRRRP